jgi:regulatory protein
MAGTITALKIQQRNRERVNIFIDDQYAFAVTLMAAAELKKGQQLSDIEIDRLKATADFDRGYNQAIRYLGFRPRSQVEVERYLKEKQYTPELIESIVQRLQQQQYLDDEAFARFWLESRERAKPKGAQALRYELRQKGLPGDIIDAVVSNLNEDESAWGAVEKKLYQWQNLDKQTFRQKVMAHLSRRGFSYEVTMQTAIRAWRSLHTPE